jgi:hypothetical protein
MEEWIWDSKSALMTTVWQFFGMSPPSITTLGTFFLLTLLDSAISIGA